MKTLKSDSAWFWVPFGAKDALEMNERNLARAEQAKKERGSKFLLHPSNRVVRNTAPFALEVK